MTCINCLIPRAPLLREKDNASLGSPKKRACKSRERRRGAAAAEFAIVLPVFVLLIVGILEFGRMIMVQQILTNASREGARLACIDGSTESNVQTAVTQFLTNASVSGVTVTCTPSTLSSATPGSQITVQTSVPFDQVSWIASSWFATDVTLSSSCMMRREGIP
jgi:Flp pilus assembly protein TadG